MAFLVTSRLLMKQLIKSEKIFKNIVKVNSIFSNISDKYVTEIKNMKIDPNVIPVTELLEFPSKTFYWIDKKSLEYIIHNSYNIIKEKGLATTPEVYKSILKTYLFDRIDFDVENLLKDMSANHIELDQEIYNYIIRYYCNNRKMDVVEDFLRDMESKGIGLNELMKLIIISGYTAAKQSEKSEIFIRENQLEPNGFDVLYSKCYGFACSGDMDNLKKNLFEIKEKKFLLTGFHCKLLYSRLLSANVEKSSLDQSENDARTIRAIYIQLRERWEDHILLDKPEENTNRTVQVNTEEIPANTKKQKKIEEDELGPPPVVSLQEE